MSEIDRLFEMYTPEYKENIKDWNCKEFFELKKKLELIINRQIKKD